jgi:hypothetical protein
MQHARAAERRRIKAGVGSLKARRDSSKLRRIGTYSIGDTTCLRDSIRVGDDLVPVVGHKPTVVVGPIHPLRVLFRVDSVLDISLYVTQEFCGGEEGSAS